MGATARERVGCGGRLAVAGVRGQPPAGEPAVPWPWPRGPARPLASAGSLHVWHAELDAVPDDMVALLSRAEHERWRRILSPQRGRRWAASRALLRSLLGAYLGEHPHALDLGADRHGRPVLAGCELNFSVSHSGPVALYATAQESAVGVDVERERRGLDERALAARALGPGEARRLQSLSQEHRRQEFARAWVRNEAELKWRGTGFGPAAGAGGRARAPWLSELDPGAGLTAAVAADGPPRELCCWRWTTG